MIVDETGRAFDLVRQLDGVKTKEVRARLRHEKLITDKQAIEEIRERQTSSTGKREKQKVEYKPSTLSLVSEFAENRNKVFVHNLAEMERLNHVSLTHRFINQGQELSRQPPVVKEIPKLDENLQRKQEAVSSFAENRNTALDKEKILEEKRQKIAEEQERQRQRSKQKKLHR